MNDKLGVAHVDLATLRPQLAKGKHCSIAAALKDAEAATVGAGRLRVMLERASNLRAADKDGLSDPYVAVRCGGRAEKTEVVTKSLNPRFNTTFSFGFASLEAALSSGDVELEAWDQDTGLFAADDSLGRATLALTGVRDVASIDRSILAELKS